MGAKTTPEWATTRDAVRSPTQSVTSVPATIEIAAVRTETRMTRESSGIETSGGGAEPSPTGTNPGYSTESGIQSSHARDQAEPVFDTLATQIRSALWKKGPGVLALPGLLKITVIQKPATPARKGINPFTKEEQVFKAKPSRRVVKVRPLRALKDMAT